MLVCLDYESDIPLYQQIRNQIVIGIASGELPEGERLPTIRSLADDLGINMMTVSKAYQLLKSEGCIYGDRRNGALVRKPKNTEGKTLGETSQCNLEIIASEAKLNGMSLEEFVMLCSNIYKNVGDKNAY